jgi:hypothetical protein
MRGNWVVVLGGFGLYMVGIIVLHIVHPLFVRAVGFIVMGGFVFWVFAVNGRFDLLAFFQFVDYEGFCFKGVWVLSRGCRQAKEVSVRQMNLLQRLEK